MTIDSDTTHLSMALDESGSMSANQAAVVAGFNDFIENLRQEEARILTSVVMFDTRLGEDRQPDNVRFKRVEVPIEEIEPLTTQDYVPSGNTPLNDAILATIENLEKHVNGDKAMVVVMTDGYENASKADTKAVREAITAKEAEGWAFIYLGANQDTWAEGGARGMGAAGQSLGYTSSPVGTQSAMASASGMAAMYSRKGTSNQDVYASNTVSSPSGVIPEAPPVDPDSPYVNKDAVKAAKKNLKKNA